MTAQDDAARALVEDAEDAKKTPKSPTRSIWERAPEQMIRRLAKKPELTEPEINLVLALMQRAPTPREELDTALRRIEYLERRLQALEGAQGVRHYGPGSGNRPDQSGVRQNLRLG